MFFFSFEWHHERTTVLLLTHLWLIDFHCWYQKELKKTPKNLNVHIIFKDLCDGKWMLCLLWQQHKMFKKKSWTERCFEDALGNQTCFFFYKPALQKLCGSFCVLCTQYPSCMKLKTRGWCCSLHLQVDYI